MDSGHAPSGAFRNDGGCCCYHGACHQPAIHVLSDSSKLLVPAPQNDRVMMKVALSQNKGAGNAGRPMRPQPRVQNKKAHEHSHHGHAGFTRHSPRNGFN